MKTFDKKDVYSWNNAEEAKKYIGKEGYFTDYFSENLDDWDKDKLVAIHQDESLLSVFQSKQSFHGLFLPADKVIEKQWRAFKDFEELVRTLHQGVSSEIIYRTKKEPLRKITTLIMGYITEDNHEDLIILGISTLPLSSYFKEIEIWNDREKQWQPFGVKE